MKTLFIACCFLLTYPLVNGGRIRHSRKSSKKIQECREPKDLDVRRRELLAPASVHPSLYGLPFFQPEEMAARHTEDSRESSDIFIGDRICPKTINTQSEKYLDRSTCPSYYVITHNTDRIPATIVEARCKCEKCISLMPNGVNLAECRKIFYYTPVLRKTGCNNETMEFEYKKMFEPVSVGCTCVHPLLNQSNRKPDRRPRPAISFTA